MKQQSESRGGCRHQPEAQLHRSLVEHLRWCARSDVWWAHIPNGGARTAIEGAIFKSLGVQPGAPDLLVVRAGQALFVECKAPGRKLSPSQVECHDALRRAGAAVETTDNIDHALGFLRRHGVVIGAVSDVVRRMPPSAPGGLFDLLTPEQRARVFERPVFTDKEDLPEAQSTGRKEVLEMSDDELAKRIAEAEAAEQRATDKKED